MELVQANSAYPSQAGKKYLEKIKLTVHRSAAWMIARRAINSHGIQDQHQKVESSECP